ncbi:hypothetical protein ACFQ9U_23150 [Streptomyces sp. NPDC056568]|uniref:hypothetical protein n=1 Tax=Streptomyces sp. NPDC056568 TaxID=3345866 RepID=UPI00368182D3
MAHTTHIAPVTLGTNGHLPFVVRAAEATAARAEQPEPQAGACHFRDCEDTEPGHFDHFAHSPEGLEVKDGDDRLIEAGFASCSGSDPAPVVYLRNWEANNMAELEAKVDEIKRMLDATLEFGARVFADGAQA